MPVIGHLDYMWKGEGQDGGIVRLPPLNYIDLKKSTT